MQIYANLPQWAGAGLRRDLRFLILVLSMLLVGMSYSYGQSLSRTVYASGSSFGTSTDGQLSSTYGQVWIQTTAIANEQQLTQGFQQPDRVNTVSIRTFAEARFHLYPNPSTDHVVLEGDTEQIARYAFTNSLGQSVQQGRLFGNRIDHPGLAEGVYLLQLFDREEALVSTVKLIVR